MNKSWLIPTLLFPVTLAVAPAATAQTVPDGPLTVTSSASGDAVGCGDFFAIKSAEIVGGRLQLRAENHGDPVAWDLAVKGGGVSAWKRLQMIATLRPLPQDASARIKGKFTGFGLEGSVLGILSNRGYSECLVKFTMARAGSDQAETINAGANPLVPKSDIANRPGTVKTGAPAREQVLEQIREQVRERARKKASQVAAVEPAATLELVGKIKSDTVAIVKPPGADIPDGKVSPFRIGQIYEAFAQIFDGSDHMQIPLPAGVWHVIGVKEAGSTSGISTLATVYLLQTADKRMVSVAIIGYPVVNRSQGWRVPSWCTRGRKHHFEGRAMHAGTQIDCWGVAHAEMTKAKETSSASQVVRYAQSLGIKVPANTVSTQYVRANYGRYFRVAYYVNPEMAGLGPPEHADLSSSDYHPDRIGNYPKKKAFIEHVKKWSKTWKKAIDLGFAGELDAARMAEFAELHPLTGPVAAPPSPQTVEKTAERTVTGNAKPAVIGESKPAKAASSEDRPRLVKQPPDPLPEPVAAPPKPRNVERTAEQTVIGKSKPAGAASVEDRLRRIKRLLEEGLITADEATALRREALKDF